MTMLHLDIWAQSQGVGLDLIATGGASNRVNIASNDGEWSSVDIPLTAFPSLDLSKIYSDLIIDYNEDDCIATRVIKDWLMSVT